MGISMIKVDVHIITRPKDNKVWLQECLDSLIDAPVNIFMIKGTKGHIGKGRGKGYLSGTSPYVAIVDPDDMVISGAFQACIDAMTDDCSGVFTDEIVINKDGDKIRNGYSTGTGEWDWYLTYKVPAYGHHLIVMKREYVEQYINEIKKHSMLCEQLLSCLISKHGRLIHLPIDGYKWRLHTKGSHHSFIKPEFKIAKEKVLHQIKLTCKELDKIYKRPENL